MDAAQIEKGPVAPSPSSSGAGTLVALVFVAVALGLCVAAAAVFAGAVVGAGDLQTDRQQFRDVYVFMVGERAAESLFGGDAARVVGMEVDQKGRRLKEVRNMDPATSSLHSKPWAARSRGWRCLRLPSGCFAAAKTRVSLGRAGSCPRSASSPA